LITRAISLQVTRAAAERAKAELAARHVDDTEPEQQVTAEEWLAAHRAALAQDEPHRDITETDVRDADRADEDTLDDQPGELGHAQPEVPDRDLREIAAEEPVQLEEDVVRVPSAAETSDAIQRTNRALVEIRARDAADAQEAAEHRAEELTRWHSDDQAAETVEVDEDVAGDEPVVRPGRVVRSGASARGRRCCGHLLRRRAGVPRCPPQRCPDGVTPARPRLQQVRAPDVQ
jgi:hypothetical protein